MVLFGINPIFLSKLKSSCCILREQFAIRRDESRGPVFKKNFASDNNSGILPEVMDAMAQINVSHCHAYGGDEVTEKALALFRQHFGKNSETFFVFNGTAANVLSLRSLLEPHEAAIVAQTSHLNMDECGAPESRGIKLLAVATANGKLTPASIQPYLVRKGDQHCVQPQVISITQPTELGTTYSIAEIEDLTNFARAEGLLVHMDGARLVNAAAHLGRNSGRLDPIGGRGLFWRN